MPSRGLITPTIHTASGSFPDVLLGLDRKLTPAPGVFTAVELSPETMKTLVGNMEHKAVSQSDILRGFKVLDQDRNVIGIWYSPFLFNSNVRVKDGVAYIAAPGFSEQAVRQAKPGNRILADMCLILFSYLKHPRYKFILAGNRDEFYERPTQSAGFWEEDGNILAGKDLKLGGTWLGITRNGRFAAITNYREPGAFKPDAPSRGKLVSGFLEGTAAPCDYLRGVAVSAGTIQRVQYPRRGHGQALLFLKPRRGREGNRTGLVRA